MTHAVTIAASVALAEAQAQLEFQRTRSLIQAQAIADLKAELAALQTERAPAPDSDEVDHG
ncbi:hypothetical protein Q9299_05115 [Gemmobacter fulvus]|uniref:hypothetical protein n=1 Tax=Gemmobacter fulvus TaxID=2840474 RepID=UPI002796D759|nr:hypothetical protein [Gemmobacter fulvus]MDQ1847662.1 hypothetical protein [Gemmobacter fulvus]